MFAISDRVLYNSCLYFYPAAQHPDFSPGLVGAGFAPDKYKSRFFKPGSFMRGWWNWQTRQFEGLLGQPLQVQVLSRAPYSANFSKKIFRPWSLRYFDFPLENRRTQKTTRRKFSGPGI